MSVHWRLHKRMIILLGLAVVVGIVIGIMTAVNPKIKADSIPMNLIDTNLNRVIRPTATFGGIVSMRILGFALTFVLVFLLCLNKWTVIFTFIVAGYHGFAGVMNLYWILAKFGFTTGLVLMVIYFLLLITLAIMTVIMIVYCMRLCEGARNAGWRGAISWIDFRRGCLSLALAITVFALVEYLFFLLIISRIVFVI